MRAALATVSLLAACGGDAELAEAQRYLTDARFRRAALVGSLVTHDNAYARLRLARYDSGDARDWSRLPVWNPPAAPSPRDDRAPLAIPASAARGDLAALRALGGVAFARYPAMLLAPDVGALLDDPARAARYGFRAPTGGGGDLVWVTLPGGLRGVALTCAACHRGARAGGEALEDGLANASLQLGALLYDGAATHDPTRSPRLLAWGAGRVDVSSDDGREPVAMPDLRTLRFQRYLHRAGAVRGGSIPSLAVRIETLLTTNLRESVRPPREVALGLALYLDGLGEALEGALPAGAGAAVFATRCGRCHGGDGLAGPLVTPEDADTRNEIARSPQRGTGFLRVPSLRGVGARRSLLHDGSVADLDTLLDPTRAGSHRVGRALGADDRAALRRFLLAL